MAFYMLAPDYRHHAHLVAGHLVPSKCWLGNFLLNEGMEAFMGTSTNYKANKKAIFSFISRNGGLIVKGECKVNVGRHHWDERQT